MKGSVRANFSIIHILSKTTDSPRWGLVIPIFPFDTYDVFMQKFLPVFAISALLLTGCSTPTTEFKTNTDDLLVIQWQTCLNHFIEVNKDFYSTSEITTLRATEACKTFLPVRE